jgi:hypothetical protein
MMETTLRNSLRSTLLFPTRRWFYLDYLRLRRYLHLFCFPYRQCFFTIFKARRASIVSVKCNSDLPILF